MKIAIITGPRQISPADEQLVSAVVREIIARGFQIYVGDAAGVDAIAADEAYPHEFHMFYPLPKFGRTPAGLAERSTRMVKEALRAYPASSASWSREAYEADQNGKVICVGFPNKPCPAGIVPAKYWKTGNKVIRNGMDWYEVPGSGGSVTWSTLALAVGHEIETWILPLPSGTFRYHYWSEGREDDWPIAMEVKNFSSNATGWHFKSEQTLFEVKP